MKKIEKYLEEIQRDEKCSAAAGIGFNIDSPTGGGVLRKPYPKKKYNVATLPDDKKKRNKKRTILIDE